MTRTHRGILLGVLGVVSRPRLALAVAGAVVAVCATLAFLRLDISSNTNELFDPDVPFFRDYLRFIELFPENEAVYVVVQTRDPRAAPPVARWTDFADALAARLRAMPQYVKSVDAKVPIDQLGPQGLLFDDPRRLRQNFADVQRFVPLAKLWGEEPNLLTRALGASPMERFLGALQFQPADEETAGFVAALAQSWNVTAQTTGPLRVGEQVPDLAALGAAEPSFLGYYYVPDESDRSRNLLLVRVYEKTEYDSLTAISESVEAIRSAVADVAKDFPEFSAGVTGRPALEADELRTSDRDSHRAEAVALTAVFIGLVVMLRSAWLALAGVIALCVGIGWTFGWATLSVGRLNLLSIVFLLALIGIGMDYLVQILTRYRLEASRRSDPRTIWVGVFRTVAAPINTACLGAAGAFLVSTFTRFRGAAELGIIAGGGLLLCLLAGYVVLPALLTLLPPRFARRKEPHPDLGPPARGTRRKLIVPAVWIALLLAGIPLALQTGFNPSLIGMQAPNLESVKLVDKLQTWSAVVLSRDLGTLRAARDAVADAPTVSHTESILLAYDNLEWLRDHESEMPRVSWAKPAPIPAGNLPGIANRAAALAERFGNAGKSTTGPSGSFAEASAALSQFAATVRGAEGAAARQLAERLSQWQVLFVEQLQSVLAPFHPSDLDLSKLPHELKSHFVAADGTYALYVYPKANLWEHAPLRAFVRDLEQRVAAVPGEHTLTGIASNVLGTTSSIRKSFGKATAYALALIFVLVLIDLRHLGQTLFAISVLALGLPMLVALMGLLDVDWNFANFFGLPILIGAGHEYGVFLVHRYREAVRYPSHVWRRWDVSDRALLLCAYITSGSFGFFWLIAHHQGLRSLGLVMALGTACIYLAAVLVLRPLLLWRLARNRKEG
jgi:predicted RND superfamily exporter protein